ncbi:MAG: hypothetical protein Fur0037_29280 [Planctomycetota bacterium]
MVKGSTPILLVLGLAFLAAFWLQRARSPFLAIERDAEAMRLIAGRSGVDTASAMALRELLGTSMPASEFESRCARFGEIRRLIGDPLAVLTVAGDEELARRELARAGGDSDLAWKHLSARTEAMAALRFLAVRERFRARSAARD